MKLKILCDAAGIACPAEHWEDEVDSIVTDSRAAQAGSLYVCLCGTQADGHSHAPSAVRSGARWIVYESGRRVERLPDALYLSATDTRKAAARLFHAWYGFPCERLRMIGVTGTNGKTTVSHMIAHILSSTGRSCGLIGTLGCYLGSNRLSADPRDPMANMTTPDPEVLYRVLAEMAEEGAEDVVMEVSSHALVQGRVDPIRFSVSVFTNLTPEHLDFHRTMEAYANAKAMLFAASDCGIVSADSPYASRMALAKETVYCSTDRTKSDSYACDASFFGGERVRYTLKMPGESVDVECPIPGSFTVINSMQAALCAHRLGVSYEEIRTALASMHGVRGRMERVALPLDADFTVLLDYAHTPDALEQLLRSAWQIRSNGKGRIILLFGCGGDRDREKRPIMGRIASHLADYVVLTSDNSRSEDKKEIIKQILKGFDFSVPCTVICDRGEAIVEAVLMAREGDLLLLAGKGHEEYELEGSVRRCFCEREIVLEAYQLRKKRM